MKKIILGLSVFMMTLVSAQNYPDYYPNNNYGSSNYYGDEDDQYYFPEDYYYEYPADYYNSNLYRNYYSDYRRSINDVNWNRFFATQRLSNWQVHQIMMLNDSFSSFSAWNSVYRYNPDRWYYDRFYALQRILGSGTFIVFQNNFYNGYNPVAYYQNYNRRAYARNVYVVPRYRNVNVNVYRVNKVQYHQSNPRNNIGFKPESRSGQTQTMSNSRTNGLRNDGNGFSSSRSRNNTYSAPTSSQQSSGRDEAGSNRNNTVRRDVPRPNQNRVFRSGNGQPVTSSRDISPSRTVERSEDRSTERGSSTRNTTERSSGQRLTSR